MDIRIQTLGRFAVTQGEEILPRFSEQPTRAAVLLYLAVEQCATRDAVEAVIWADLPPERARHSLNQTLYRLRKDLGEEWLSGEGDLLRITESLRVDVHEFKRRVKEGAVGEALALYGGSFLEGWHLLGTTEFEHWTDRHRLRLSRLHREACRSRMAELSKHDLQEEALGLARDWVRLDPMEDEAHHSLIHLLASVGERAEALERYEVFQKLLAEDELVPLDATRELVERLRAGTFREEGAESKPTPSLPVVDAQTDDGLVAPRRRRLANALRFGLPVLLLGIFLYALTQTSGPEAVPAPNRVLVFPFENQTSDPSLDPLGQLVADWIAQGLATVEFLQVIPSQDLVIGGGSGGIGETGARHSVMGRRAAEEAGAGILVTGAFYASDPGMEFHVRILEVPGFEILESVNPVRSSSSDPMDAVNVLRQRVLVTLAVHRNEALGGLLSESAMPPSYPAYLAYVEGGRKMARNDWRGATADLLRANELSPEFTAPLIYAGFALIIGWRDFAAADSVARIVEASLETLPAYDRLRLELLQATLEGDNPRAFQAVKQAAAILPGGSAHYTSGSTALGLNRPREALEILSTWDPTRESISQWAPYWNTVAGAHHSLGDHERELTVARQGREQIPDRMETLWYETRALAALGRVQEVDQRLEESFRFRWSSSLNPGQLMLLCANELRTHGHFQAADSSLNRFPAWHDGLSAEQRSRWSIRFLRAEVLYRQGQLESARQRFLDLLNENPGDPEILRYLGAVAAREGDRDRAIQYAEELAHLDRPYLFGRHTWGRAIISALLGEKAQAVTLLQTSVSQGVGFDPILLSEPDLQPLRDFPPFLAFLEPRG